MAAGPTPSYGGGVFLRHARLLLVGLLSGTGCAPPAAQSSSTDSSTLPRGSDAHGFQWPGRARAAVSLTYDDALPSQRENATRQLAAYRFNGTFFLTGTSKDLAEHPADWRAMMVAGNEFGSHTMHHPCDRSFDWVKPGYAFQDYDLGRMKAELQETVAMLQKLGARVPYTFAYPCGGTGVGEPAQSYVGLVQDLFLAARGVDGRIANPRSEKLEQVPAFDGARPEDQLIGLVDRAVAEQGWLVLYFHGVGGDHMMVTLDAHEALLARLEQLRDTVWTERFGVVAAHVKAQRR